MDARIEHLAHLVERPGARPLEGAMRRRSRAVLAQGRLIGPREAA
jgi:hypothetical protein